MHMEAAYKGVRPPGVGDEVAVGVIFHSKNASA